MNYYGLIETFIQYGVLGVLGYIAIKTFVKQFKNSDDYMRKLFEYLIKEKKDDNTEVLDSLSTLIQMITKNKETLIKFKYEISIELQNLTMMVKEIDNSTEDIKKIRQDIEGINKSLKILVNNDKNEPNKE